MTNWKSLMTNWNTAILNSSLKPKLNNELVSQGWLGKNGASNKNLMKLEERLETKLPPSYRKFLMFTNGWEGVLTHSIYKLWSTDYIDWLTVRNQEWTDSWEKVSQMRFNSYDEGPDEDELLEIEHFATSLEISDRGDGAIIVLNPNIVDESGEWEAWFVSTWMPEVIKFTSFGELMEDAYKTFVELEKDPLIRGNLGMA